jgi:lipopolysaccharide transport system ATP-binding protein
MPPAIRVENLSKSYRINHAAQRGAYRTIRESLMEGASSLVNRWRRDGSDGLTEEFWALKGVDFEVQPGEVVGVIGRNGAGKSTLLKVLSRITEPTEGRIRLRGRVGSLLEVGTGFHHELSGRENIYLNGAILGMSRREIARNFDGIVAFAEVDKFLDTPVKRYSSGMYVRLAFAVAAYLEPEILVVDEVLAVGDLSFQKKCLGKMREVADGGRTVLFVSHNMPTIIQLCPRVILMEKGRIARDGTAEDVVQSYYREGRMDQAELKDLVGVRRDLYVNRRAQFVSCRLATPDRTGPWSAPFGSPIRFEFRVKIERPIPTLEFGIALCNATGTEIASPMSSDSRKLSIVDTGEYSVTFSLPNLTLCTGTYILDLGIRSDRGLEDYIREAIQIEVEPTGKSSEMLLQHRRGAVIPEVEFGIEKF